MKNITDINSRTKDIYSYISDVLDIGESGTEIIKDCLSSIHSITPLEGAQIFSKLERVNSCSDNLSYLIFMIDSKRSDLVKEYNSKRDPLYVALVRSDRPSDKAISAEIRLQNKDVVNLENSIEVLDNIRLYLSHVEKGLNEYSKILRDKISYCK